MTEHYGLPYSFPEVDLSRLQGNTKMTEEEAAEMLEKFRRNFPSMRQWMDEQKKKLKD